jgi:hypothetical protein
MKITDPNAFERSYRLEGTAGQHLPQVIREIVAWMEVGIKMTGKSETPDRRRNRAHNSHTGIA